MINWRGKRVDREAVFLPPLSLWELRTKILMKSASAPMFIRCFRNQAKVPICYPWYQIRQFQRARVWREGCNFYHPEADGGISILDDTLGIDWKIPTEHANLSKKDTKHAMLNDSPLYIKNVTLSLWLIAKQGGFKIGVVPSTFSKIIASYTQAVPSRTPMARALMPRQP